MLALPASHRLLFTVVALLCGLVLFLTSAPAARAADDAADGPFADSFDVATLGPAWQTTGPVSLDAAKNRQGKGAALQIAPTGSASLSFGGTDGGGTLELWVYDDLTAPANPKTRRGGPQWGLRASDGTLMVVGSIYAPFLSGEKSFAAATYTPEKKEAPWFKVQYLGLARAKGWHRWTFTMDPETGLAIAMDGKKIGRFDWNKTGFGGFSGIVLLGDSQAKDGQTLWVDDVTVTRAGAMQAVPTAPPPAAAAASVVPAQDPALDGPPAVLVEAVRGVHPRLFFRPEDLDGLRKRALSPAMAAHWKELLGYLPSCKPPKTATFLTDATDGQRQGLWRMPTLAMHYLVTSDPDSLARAKGFMQLLLDLPHWETGAELDAGMSSANVMVGAAICYDWLYADLDPAFREAFRQKLLLMARAQYHGGHLNANKSTGYWQSDTQNNHRWHRDAGLALAVFAAYEGKPEEAWILTRTAEELAFVAKWLPADGTSHESPSYLTFGMPHLTLAMDAADRCLGTDYLQAPFFKNVAAFKTQTLTPDLADGFQYGDSNGIGGYNAYLWRLAAVHRLPDVQAAIDTAYAANPKVAEFGWFALLWKDPALSGVGKVEALPTVSYFDDLGLAFMRDRWSADAVAAMFKCGPLGGHLLNRYRNENGGRYINVAHDDPDANSFTIWSHGGFVAETDRYAKHKRSANHNTVLVNGKGQVAKGRPEGAGWSQPATGNWDMTQMAYITGYTEAGDTVIIEGEAGGSYPDLTRFRRSFIWVKGGYILILDDLQSPLSATFTWLLQAPKLSYGKDFGNDLQVHDTLALSLLGGGNPVPVQIAVDRKSTVSLAVSSAENRGKPLGWKQLQLGAEGRTWRVVSLYNPWNRPKLTLNFDATAVQDATIRVSGDGIDDTWSWTLATDPKLPSTLKGKAELKALPE